MNELLVATRSLGKQKEFRELLAGSGRRILFPDDIDLGESAEEAGLESFETFVENARAKATWFAVRTGLPTLADDSGLEVDALGGAPGVHSKRFAGGNGPDHLVTAANNAALLAALKAVEPARRGARYRCVLLYFDPTTGHELVSEGVTIGRILEAPLGAGGFGYDPLFLSDDLRQTFGEASPSAKHGVSHRGRAAKAMVTALREQQR